jgi:hypothetical protein
LPASSSGGSALGSADALREGSMAFGTGSKAQYGFMQDRTPVWIANIRSIPDQVLPPILTFGVESSRGDDESGGRPIIGPKIAGNARTSSVPGWLGHCLYVAREPHNPAEVDDLGVVRMYHRLWLTTHVDPRDPGATPIVAKHRGEPLGMPPFLEDPPEPDKAWSVCSLRVFYRLLRDQMALIEARDRARYPDAPALRTGGEAEDDQDEVVEAASTTDTGGPASIPTPSRIVRRSRRPGAGAPSVAQLAAAEQAVEETPAAPAAAAAPAPAPTPPPPAAAEPATTSPATEAPAAPASTASAPAATPAAPQATSEEPARAHVGPIRRIRRAPVSPIVEQLQATLALAQVHQSAEGPSAAAPAPAPPPAAPVATPPAPSVSPTPVSSAAPPPVAGPINRIRRVPRPPA